MRVAAGVRLLVVCLGLWMVGLWGGSAAWAQSAGVLGGTGGSPMESPLVAPGPQLAGGESVAVAEEVSRNSPVAVLEREASQTKYEGLGGREAVSLAQASFPGLVDNSAGGPPPLAVGQKITGFVDGSAAQVELGEGQQGVIESVTPMAIASSPGHWVAINLGLSEGSNGFSLANPLVELAIPKRLASGVGVPGSEVALTPVDGTGAALGGSEGVVAGAVVVYANTQLDTDTVIKPTTFGFDAIGLLRSSRSPQELDYKLSLPAGASLVQEASTGLVRVVKEGATIGMVAPPSASDAAGTPVPVKMSVTGDAVAIDVNDRTGSYQYPIEVDPEYFNTTTEASSSYGDWHFFETERGGYTYSKTSGHLTIGHTGSYGEGDWAYWAFQTKGESKVYKLEVADELYPTYGTSETGYVPNTYPFLSAWIEINYETLENKRVNLSGQPYLKSASVCTNETCYPSGIHKENEARFWLETTETSKFFEERGETYNIPFGGFLSSATVYLAQPQALHSTVSYNTSSLEVGGQTNVFANGGHWFGPSSGAFEFTARDTGLGVAETKAEYYSGGAWHVLRTHNFLTESAFCTGVECAESQSEVLTYHSTGMGGLPEGNDQLRVAAHDADGSTWSSEHSEGEATIKVDATAPHGLKLSGLEASGEELELGEVEGHVQLEASDGEGTVKSSGIKSIALAIDGKETGKQAGSCAEGPCTAKGEVTINGAELGVGRHTLTVKATDNAGNVATKNYTLNVYAASPVAAGPGSVNPESGDYAMEASDVNISGGSGVLAVTRHYDSRNVQEGIEGPLGPQWTLSLGSLASLEVLPDGSVMVIGPDGLTHFTTKTGGGFEAPAGDTNLTLEYEAKEKEYLLKDPGKGTTTSFTLPSGASSWMPTVSKGPVATDTMTDTYQTAEPEAGKKIVEPTLELAPHANTTCEPKKAKEEAIKMKEGCRALEFTYGESTKATGENQSQWGEYKGRLKTVTFIAFNPATKKMVATPIAEYVYDSKGRLRSEWNPQTPELKTDYGYDAAGHITAFTPPGAQPWIFDYGAIPGDTSAGRLLSITRPSASTAAGNGVLPQNTAAPTISGSPTINSTLSVSQGTWNNSPVSYGYQWEKCSSTGGSCAPIPGATNATYVPETGSVEHKLLVQVTATNMDGSATVASVALLVAKPTRFFSAPYGKTGSGSGQFNAPEGEAVDSKGNLWVVDKNNNRIEKLTSAGVYVASYGKEGSGEVQFKKPTGIAISPSTGNLFITDTGNNRVEVLTPEGKYVTAFGSKGEGNGQLNEPAGIAYSGNDVYVADTGNNRVEVFTFGGGYVMKFGSKGTGKNEFTEPEGVATSRVEGSTCLYVADKGNNRLQVLGLEGGTYKFEGAFGSKGTGNGQFTGPVGVTGSEGIIDVVDSGNGRVEILEQPNSCLFSEEHVGENIKYTAAFGTKGSGTYGQFGNPQWIAEQSTGTRRGDLYVSDSENNRVIEASETAFEELPEPLPPAPNTGTKSQWTVEYGVPLEGAGAPQQMGLNKSTGKPEPEKWAQKDDPVYAAAIFPPDKPMGWPAIEYKRETVYYLDHQARMVNLAGPAGGISTEEYNADNEVQRSLSPANRALALEPAEGTTAEERALLLDTKSVYSAEGQLVETRGPQHTVKLAVGKEKKPGEEVPARNHIRYYYNEGAPEGETFNLVTKTIDGAETTSGEEFDPRTSLTSYSGQKGLGWKLRRPTSTTTDPAGLNLTSTTEYNETTGNVIETKTPGGTTQTAHDTKTIYYTSEANSEYPECGKHIEWANLPCQTQPVSQPADNPKLPVTTITYNMWDQIETTEEAFKETSGTIKRKKITTFDAAGRPLSTEETSSIDASLPAVTDKYNTTNGTLETQSTTSGSTTETITSLYNTLGQPESYTDADKNTAKYKYDVDGRVTNITDSSNESKSEQSYTYSTTTGALSQLVDSAAGAFTATYDVQGRITSESYPNGMTANYTYNPAGSETGIEYQKLTDCTEKCVWFSDNVTPGIHGETLKQTSTLSQEPNYTYDAAGRLTQVQESPAGEGCTTRAYGYNEESDRTSLTTYKPNSKGECATAEATTEHHTYDEANRLTDANITYEPFGNTTKLPENDAGGGAELNSTFYVDNQADLTKQGEKSNEYKLDPEGRTRETITKTGKPGKETETKTITHYDAPGGTLAWTSEGGEKWTRNIPGIGGELAAIQTNPGATTLQLHDLQGNIVAEASLSETETKLLKTYNSTEFGVPNSKTTPPKYAWLGAAGIASELPSGTITQDGSTYIPQTGLPLQTQGIYIPAATNTGTPYTSTADPWTAATIAIAAQQLTIAQQQHAAEQASENSGVAPSSYCDEEVEGCGPDPEHGIDTAGCGVWVSWKHYLSNDLGVNAHFVCNYDVTIEIEVALLLEEPGGSHITVRTQKHVEPFLLSMKQYAWSPGGWACTAGDIYQAWAFGRYWNEKNQTVWSATAEDGHYEKCPQELPDVEKPSGDS